MKKDFLYIPFVIVGSTIGYFIVTKGSFSAWDLFREIFSGAVVGYICRRALVEKKYGIIIGGVIGLIVALSVDWIAGSPVDMMDKLLYISLCSFIGWVFDVIWKQMLVGGLIGGTIGFVWGLSASYRFGQVRLAPGVLNASLLAVQLFILGMGVVVVLIYCFGLRLGNKKER